MKVSDRCGEVDSATDQLIHRAIYSTIDKKRIRKIYASAMMSCSGNSIYETMIGQIERDSPDFEDITFKNSRVLHSKSAVVRS